MNKNRMNNILLINNKKIFRDFDSPINGIYPKKSSLLFIGKFNMSLFDHFDITKQVFPVLEALNTPDNKYIILVGKGDYFFENLESHQIPSNIVRIYCNNYVYDNEIIKFFPMGRDFRSKKQFKFSNIKNKKRQILCYCNFSINTHKDRKVIYKLIEDKQFIKFEHMGRFLKYPISKKRFFKTLSKSKFVICPRGNAIDTFRFYDALYSGAIPIVVREGFHKYFETLPILFLDRIEDFKNLTPEFLNKEYIRLSLLKKDYYEVLDMDFWLDKIKNDFRNNIQNLKK